MRTFNQKSNGRHLQGHKRISRALVALTALVLLQGCKTMEEREAYARAIGTGIVGAAEIDRQNRQEHQRLVEWQNANNVWSKPLPMRQPAAQGFQYWQQQPTQIQRPDPAYTPNPSQEFLNQGMWSRPGN